jgi:hypothetical protein
MGANNLSGHSNRLGGACNGRDGGDARRHVKRRSTTPKAVIINTSELGSGVEVDCAASLKVHPGGRTKATGSLKLAEVPSFPDAIAPPVNVNATVHGQETKVMLAVCSSPVKLPPITKIGVLMS